jgi:hypothetical protein
MVVCTETPNIYHCYPRQSPLLQDFKSNKLIKIHLSLLNTGYIVSVSFVVFPLASRLGTGSSLKTVQSVLGS